MNAGVGKVLELLSQDRLRYARISCPSNLIPSPGQYLLASDGPESILPVPVYSTDSTPDGFIAAPASDSWTPGTDLFLRGPLGRGYTLPPFARKIGLVDYNDSPFQIRGLIRQALKQGAAVTLLTDSPIENLPDEVEIQPLRSLNEILAWADYTGFVVARESLPELAERVGKLNRRSNRNDAEVFVRTPMPCGGVADCGVCAVITKSEWKLACKDGPVFSLGEILM